jgi:hypothetical protein
MLRPARIHLGRIRNTYDGLETQGIGGVAPVAEVGEPLTITQTLGPGSPLVTGLRLASPS